MDAAHLHLLTNHIPILLTFLSIGLLVWAMFSKNSEHYKIAFIGFIIAGIAMVIVFESGENAEDIVENIPGITHDSIEAHEEAAEIAWWLTVILGAGGVAGLFMNKRKLRGFKVFVWGILIFALLTGGLLVYTGNLGGQIRHSEISDNQTTARLNIPETENSDFNIALS